MTTQEIIENYERECSTPSDIVDHLPLIRRYAEQCNHLTELGVRSVVSTWALLASNPKRLLSMDIEECPVEEAVRCAKEAEIDFEFRCQDGLENEIEETDLLLIDTWHTYSHLLLEMLLHEGKVGKYMLLHDTAENWPENGHPGMLQAVKDFLKFTKGAWRLKEHVEACHGMTVIERLRETPFIPDFEAKTAELREIILNERKLCRDIQQWNNYLASEQAKYKRGFFRKAKEFIGSVAAT